MLDYELLTQSIRTMRSYSPLYKLLKRELSARGWWKNRRRGKPMISNLKGVEK